MKALKIIQLYQTSIMRTVIKIGSLSFLSLSNRQASQRDGAHDACSTLTSLAGRDPRRRRLVSGMGPMLQLHINIVGGSGPMPYKAHQRDGTPALSTVQDQKEIWEYSLKTTNYYNMGVGRAAFPEFLRAPITQPIRVPDSTNSLFFWSRR